MKYLKIFAFIIFAVLVSLAAYREYSLRKKIVFLENQIVTDSVTLEIQKGLYEKSSLKANDLEKLLANKDNEINVLIQQAKEKDEKIASLIAINVTLSNQSGSIPSTQGVITNNKNERKKVIFNGVVGSGIFSVNGYTLTDPPETWIDIRQNRPLRLAASITQDSDGKWKGRISSSEKDLTLDITDVAVNPKIASDKWYSNIDISVDSMLISSKDLYLYQSINAYYNFKQFSIGPTVGLAISNDISKFYGVVFSWRPLNAGR